MPVYAVHMDVAELSRQIEDKVAPEPLLAVQAFANTFSSFEDEEELLVDAGSARDWLLVSGLAVTSVIESTRRTASGSSASAVSSGR